MARKKVNPGLVQNLGALVEPVSQAGKSYVQLIEQLFPFVRCILALVSDPLTLIGDPFPLIGDPFPLVGNAIALHRCALPLGDSLGPRLQYLDVQTRLIRGVRGAAAPRLPGGLTARRSL